MKLVHKERGLDLVGWYTLLPRAGPDSSVVPLHNQILAINESAAILAFHPDEAATSGSTGGRLPLSIYETVFESDEQRRNSGNEDKEMKDSGDDAEGDSEGFLSAAAIAATTKFRFRELSYSVETGEAEMISMDFVARGGANATSSRGVDLLPGGDETSGTRQKPVAALAKADVKGKRRAVAKEDADDSDPHTAAAAPLEPAVLSREDEELVAALTAKANAIKMLHARIQLIIKYLEGLPPSYLISGQGGAAETSDAPAKETTPAPPPSQTLLRSIQALVNRIPLLVPSTTETFEREMLSEANDVHLISLLNDVVQSVNELRDLGKKFHVVEQSRPRRYMSDHASLMSGMIGMSDPSQQRLSLVGDMLL